MSVWARNSAACSLLSPTSVLVASCAAHVEEAQPEAERRAPPVESAGQPSESVIRATLDAFAAEKREAMKHCRQGNRYFVNSQFEKALTEFRKARQLCPFDREYKAAVAKAEHALGRRPTR